tara:strand:- start:426 stop:596 length:171 start_codon:yes stop_codon:yes gene_type:complete
LFVLRIIDPPEPPLAPLGEVFELFELKLIEPDPPEPENNVRLILSTNIASFWNDIY